MSDHIDDGGPAFPVPGLHHDETFNGMSLRDRMAIAALPGLMGRDWSHMRGNDEALIATWAASSYAVADAMLRARKAVRHG